MEVLLRLSRRAKIYRGDGEVWAAMTYASIYDGILDRDGRSQLRRAHDQ